MRAAAGFYCFDAGGGQGGVAMEKLGIFAGEDVICYCGNGVSRAEVEEKGEKEGSFAGAYWTVGFLLSEESLGLNAREDGWTMVHCKRGNTLG